MKNNLKETTTLFIIKNARKYFRNTWIHRIPLTSLIYRKLFSITFKDSEKEITFRDSKFLVPTNDTAVVPSMMNGDYENYELDLLRKLLKPNYTVLDIGANIGVYSLEASKCVGKKGKIFAFEPIPDNQKLLKHNLVINNAQNVEVIHSAVGAKEGKLRIYKAKHSIATHSAGAVSDDFSDLPVTTIDGFTKKKKLKIDLIKMDVEGYEGFALEGGYKTLKNHQPILLIEFSATHLKRCGYDPKKHAKDLLKLYAYCYLVDERNDKLLRVKDSETISKLLNDNLLLSPEAIKI